MHAYWLFCLTGWILLLVCSPIAAAAEARRDPESGNWMKLLRYELFARRQYDRHVRPVHNHEDENTVDMQFSITRVHINEKEGILETNGWLGLRWTDEMMKWDPTSFGHLESLKLPSDQLWKPDIVVYNSVRGYETMSAAHSVLLSNGHVYYIPPLSLATPCQLELRYWPFDVQKCSVRFGAWSHDSSEILLGILDNHTEADLKHYSAEGSAWQITKASAGVNSLQFDCCSPPYQDVVFTVTMQRLSAFDAKVAIAPATAVWLLVLVTFFMNPHCTERVHVGCLAVLLVSVMLIYFRLTLPSTGAVTPLVVIFHVVLLGLATLSVIVTLMNSSIIRRTIPVPEWMTFLMRGKLGSFFCPATPKSTDSEFGLKSHVEDLSQSETESTPTLKIMTRSPRAATCVTSSWHHVTSLIDRLAATVYVTTTAAIALHFLLF